MIKNWWHTFWQNTPQDLMAHGGQGLDHPSRAWFNDHIKDGESILDVGCGNGLNWQSIYNSGKKVKYKGVDAEKNFIQFAISHYFPEAQFEVQNALDLKEEDNFWDIVLLRHLLEHCPHYGKPILEAFRVAEKEVVIVTWHPLTEQDKINWCEPDGEENGWMYSNMYGRENFEKYLKRLDPNFEHITSNKHPNEIYVIKK